MRTWLELMEPVVVVRTALREESHCDDDIVSKFHDQGKFNCTPPSDGSQLTSLQRNLPKSTPSQELVFEKME